MNEVSGCTVMEHYIAWHAVGKHRHCSWLKLLTWDVGVWGVGWGGVGVNYQLFESNRGHC